MTAEIQAIIPENVEEILAHLSDAFFILDREWRYTYVNEKLVQLAQMKKEDFLGKRIWDLFPNTVNTILYTELHRAVAEQIRVNFEYLDPTWHCWLENRVYPEENSVSILITDITEEKRNQQLLLAHHKVTQILAESTNFANAIPRLIQSLCETLGWQVGIFWSVDQENNVLHRLSSWHSSDLNVENSRVFNQPATLALGEGLAGQAWANGQPVWICKLDRDENFFPAAIELPIAVGNKILGAMEFFTNEILLPDLDLLQKMSAIATQIGQFIEQQRIKSLLQATQETSRRILAGGNVEIFHQDFVLANNLTDDFNTQEVMGLQQCLTEQQTVLRHRHLVEENLRYSEARYHSLAQASASIIWRTAPWGNVVDEIPNWQTFTGQTLEEYKGWGWVNALHPEDRTSVVAIWRQAFYGRKVAFAEYRVRRHDGEYRYMAIRSVPILNETEEIIEWVGMCVDITERKQAESEREQLLTLIKTEQNRLLEVNVLLDTIFNNAPIGIGVWDEKLRYVRLNQALAEINGLSQEAHIGKTVAELLPGIHAEVTEAFRHVVETGESISQETSGETPAAPGKQRYWSVNYYPIHLPGNITWVGAICEEITERKQAEAEREELLQREYLARVEAENAKEQITTILQSIADGFLAFDTEWRFTYLNHEGSRTLGRSREDLLGKNLWQEFPELADTSFGQLYQSAVALGVPLELEDYYPPFNAWFAVRAYPSSTGLSLYFRNINVRKRAEAALTESEARFRLLAENSTDIISRTTVDGIFLYLSPACYTVLGYQPEELVGRDGGELVHPEDLAEISQNYPINADLPDIYTITYRTCHKHGHYIWLETTVRAIRDRQTQEILEMQASSRDITERKQVEDKQRFLAGASEILAASLDYETTLATLARLAVPTIADWCVVDMIGEDKSIHRVAIAHADPAKQELIEQLQNYPPDLSQTQGVAEVIRSGKSLIINFVSQEQIQAVTSNPIHLKILQQLNPQSGMCVLLVVRGRVLGAMSLVSSGNRRYDAQSLMLAEELARRAAIALDNARLYTQTQQSQLAAEQAASRTARLQAITAALSESITPAQVAEVIVEQGMAALGASCALVALLINNGTELEIIRAVGYEQEAVDSWRRFSINTAAPLAQAVRTKQPVWQESTAARVARYSHLAQEYAQHNYGAWISLPLTIEGRAIGGMTLAFDENQELSQDDRAFILALTQQCAQAMERARLYAAEQTAREAAENANRIKDEFLAVLSHELRSPLNPILGWSKLLQSRKLDEKTIPQALKSIERNAKLQAQLIEDLLDISRILQGKLSLNIEPVDLTSVISAAMETVRLSAEAKSIQMHISLEPNLGQVLGDSGRLQQVVWNLLSNAVKFTPEGGRVDIRLEAVGKWGAGEQGKQGSVGSVGSVGREGGKISSPSSHTSPLAPLPLLSHAQITVSDTGKGIDPNFVPFVFEYFRQENSSTTRKFGGLGLGLAIVRHLVELHGGTVQVESQGENCGATFTVRLPLLQQPSESKLDTGDFESSSNLNNVKILVVDDDADTREFIAFLLEQYGANVTVVASADEALAALSQSLPDLLLSDIGMPEVDGCMFMRKLRTLSPEQGGQIPAIALTAYAGEMNAKQVLAAGFHKHIAKPVEPAQLIEAIANLIELFLKK
ncbi:MAG: PAS domain S-box protein [Nostoc sp. ChiSLP02]|nr:PAS domain S-box protein [Nostoc sp. DedSLP05]MDZ8097945.1 PAS domain S-box protein [Nostoc sp. DedSLP01]MDZ8187972.1 PAS domain S-box protein [Nostoc sp. ChiSLP02]